MAVTRINGNQISTSTSAIISTLSFLNPTSVMQLPIGTTAQRPTGVSYGTIRFNTTTDSVEVYKSDTDGQGNDGWGSVGGGGPSKGLDSFIRTNRNTITETITIGPSAGAQYANGFTAGPISLGTGSVVTIDTGGYWYVMGDTAGEMNSTDSIGLNPSTAASSPSSILSAWPTAPNGVYWYNHGSGPYQAYTDMGNGGWMLVAKIQPEDGNNTSWSYGGSYWSANSLSTIASERACMDVSRGNGQTRGWYEFTTEYGFRMVLGQNSAFPLSGTTSNLNNGLVVPRSGVTARNNFTGTAYNLDSVLNRASFMTWIGNAGVDCANWDNQPNCNRIGFNRTDSSNTAMRFGITFNNENECNSNDSAMGFGTYTNNDTGGTRNIPAGGHRWSGDQKFPLQGYIFVK